MKKLLIVVDFQVDFVSGALGFSGAKDLDARISEKIKDYRKAGGEIWFTLDTHTPEYPETQEGRYLPIEHCLKGSPGWELYGTVKEQVRDADRIIEKPSFGSSELYELLRSHCDDYASIELVGLVSNICVLSNAILAKTACPELPVLVDASCTACADPEDHKAALRMLKSVQVEVL